MNIEVHLIGGFLGSGKTTLLNNILKHHNTEKSIAIIINEFGDISIDGELVEHESYSKIEVTGGCICCSLKGKLIDGIKNIVENEHPDSIYIEATGLAVPWDIKLEIERNFPGDKLIVRDVIVTVDSQQFKTCHGKLLIYDRQFEGSPSVLLTKSDIYNDALLESVKDSIKKSYGNIQDIQRSGIRSESLIASINDVDRDSFTTDVNTDQFSIDSELEIDYEGIESFCREYSHLIVRLKAVLKSPGISTVFQFDGKNLFRSDRETADKTTSSRIIVFCLKAEKEKLLKIFNSVIFRSRSS